ncbi:hypothetical protein [Streptomyces sp. NPDC001380]|uniref:hypothetical protein n=1 Tax=Streptomyces sp. NPDC001380 TaxID=3364566 RepID=UPI0036A68983
MPGPPPRAPEPAAGEPAGPQPAGPQPGAAEHTGPAPGTAVSAEAAEAALVGNYARLARLAYAVLPAGQDRHRRVVAAHALVQRSLSGRGFGRRPAAPLAALPPGPRRAPAGGDAPAVLQPDGDGSGGSGGGAGGAARQAAGAAYGQVRLRVLAGALAAAGPGAGRPLPLRAWTLPRVWGLRLFTVAGAAEELALDRALAAAEPAARAACALRALEGMPDTAVRSLLARAGCDDPGRALALADRLAADHPEAGPRMASSPEFDPCTVRAQPSDLLRRRRRRRTALGVSAVLLAALPTAWWAVPSSAGRPAPPGSAAGGGPGAADPSAAVRLVRAAPDAWRTTARLDLSAWPARGDRTADRALTDRALRAWERPLPGTRVSAVPGTSTRPPAEDPRLLFAGDVDGAAVVLLHDGGRIARWTEGSGSPELLLARVDGADLTTAAVVLRRGPRGARLLLAPWVAEAATRDLRYPDRPARPLAGGGGVTAPLPFRAAGGCLGEPVLQLRSSPVVAERHAFLLADLGGPVLAHLTWMPPPGRVPPAGPREATGPQALPAWARAACLAPVPGGPDGSAGRVGAAASVRSVNLWAFAVQPLPERRGTATWVCLRTDRWTGDGAAATAVLLPASGPGRRGAVRTGQESGGRACSRFAPDVLASVWWHPPGGRGYLLVAGSRHVRRVAGSGTLRFGAAVPHQVLALPGGTAGPERLSALLASGARIGPLPPVRPAPTP